MEQGELISILESLLGPAMSGQMAPREVAGTSAARLEETPPSGLPGTPRVIEASSARPSVTGLLSASLPVGIAILDVGTLRVRRANALLATMLGRAPGEHTVLGHTMGELAPGFAGSEVEGAFAEVARTGQPFSALIEEASGSKQQTVYRRCTLNPLRTREGHVDGLLLTLLDVTDQVRTRRRLARAEHDASEHVLCAAVETEVLDLLSAAAPGDDVLPTVLTQLAEQLGDCAAFFVLEPSGAWMLRALHHRDALQGFQLRTRCTTDPLQRNEGIVGAALRTGTVVAWHAGTASGTQLAGALHPRSPMPGLVSATAAPLRQPDGTQGVLVLASWRRASGGTERVLSMAGQALLARIAAILALSRLGAAPAPEPTPVATPVATPLPPEPSAESADLAEVCARVARSHAGPVRRRLEVRMPRRRVPIAAPVEAVERAVEALIRLAAETLPPTTSLHVHIWREGFDASREAAAAHQAASLETALGVESSESVLASDLRVRRAPPSIPLHTGAVVRVTGADPFTQVAPERAAVAELEALAQALGGSAAIMQDAMVGTAFVLELPLLRR